MMLLSSYYGYYVAESNGVTENKLLWHSMTLKVCGLKDMRRFMAQSLRPLSNWDLQD